VLKKLTDLFDTLSTPNYPLIGRKFLRLAVAVVQMQPGKKINYRNQQQ
jgi:hypothetical protein